MQILCKRTGAAMKGRNQEWKPEDDLQLKQLRANGAKWSVVAKKLKKTEAATISRAGVLALQALGHSVEIGTKKGLG